MKAELMLNKNKTLIVFAPGWGDPSLVIDKLAHRFHTTYPQYETMVLSYPYRGVKDTIEDIASQQVYFLKGLRQCFDTLVFIGHSMGGLVGRQLAADIDFDLFVTIASPHKGTAIANVPGLASISRSAANMRLGAPDTLPIPDCPKLTIQAAFDPLLWPQDSAQLPGAQNVVIPFTEHITVATSQRTYLEIDHWMHWEHHNVFCPKEITIEV